MTAIATPAIAPRGRPSVLSAIAAFTRLEVSRVLANRRYVMLIAVFPVFFYLLWTNIGLEGVPSGAASFQAFFLVSMATYGAIGGALQVANSVAAERASGWTRQLRVTPLPPIAYVLAKLVASFITSLPALVLVSAAAILIDGVTLPLSTWLELIGLLALAMLPFAALGVLIGLTVQSENIQIAVMAIYFALAIVGGLWAPIDSLPDVVATIGRYLPSYRAADLGWAVAGGQPIPFTDLAWLLGYTVLMGGAVAWIYRHQEQAAGA